MDDLTPKMGAFIAKNWDEARDFARSLTSRGWAFRGHADASWKLEHSFERHWARLGINRPRAQYEVERELLAEVKAVALSDGSTNIDADSPDWLGLLQHYGCPTRLLDVTESFYVAAFFAVEAPDSKVDSAVWCFNRAAIGQALANHPKFSDWLRSSDRSAGHVALAKFGIPLSSRDLHEVLSRGGPTPPVALWRPERMSTRMAAQQGLFIVPRTPNLPLSELLAEGLCVRMEDFENPPAKLFGKQPNAIEKEGAFAAIKLMIPGSAKIDALTDLEAMNVSAASLFPGLDGLCRSMKTRFLRDGPTSWYTAPAGAHAGTSRFG